MNEQLKIALAALEEIAVWDEGEDSRSSRFDEPGSALAARKALREIKALTAPAEKCTYKCEAWPECGCAPSVAPEPDDGTVLDEVGDRIDKLLLLATEAIQRSGPPRDCADDYLIPAAEWLALQSEVMHRLREHAAALWAPGPSLWKDWCARWFGPDSDDEYLARAVADLPKHAAHPPRAPLTEEFWLMLDTALDALKYHQEQTRPIELTRVTIAAVETFISAHGIGGK